MSRPRARSGPATARLLTFQPDLERVEQQLRSHLWRREREVWRRVRALLSTVHVHHPELLQEPTLPRAVVHLGRMPWVRPLEAWRPGEGVLCGLVRHLVARFPVPPHLEKSVLQGRDRVGPRLLEHAGAGRSLRALRFLLPGGATRREAHAFLHQPDAPWPLAWRRAQVACAGGPGALADAVHAALPNPSPEDARLRPAIDWLCRRQAHPDDVAPLFDYLRRGPAPDFDPSRSLSSMRAAIEAWRLELATLVAASRGAAWEASGLEATSTRSEGLGVVTVVELGGPVDLVVEGRVLHHCVATYIPLAREGRCSIWSLRVNGRRLLTLEVRHPELQVVQIRGRCNRAPTPEELAALRPWMGRNALALKREAT